MMGQASLAQGLEFQALVCEVEKVSVPVGLGKATRVLPFLFGKQAVLLHPVPFCCLAEAAGQPAKREGEQEAGDRASLAGEAAGAQQAASIEFTLKN